MTDADEGHGRLNRMDDTSQGGAGAYEHPGGHSGGVTYPSVLARIQVTPDNQSTTHDVKIHEPGWYLLSIPPTGGPVTCTRVRAWDDRPLSGGTPATAVDEPLPFVEDHT